MADKRTKRALIFLNNFNNNNNGENKKKKLQKRNELLQCAQSYMQGPNRMADKRTKRALILIYIIYKIIIENK